VQNQEIIKNASLSNKAGWAAIIGIVTLLIGATTVFGELQDSMNGIWGLKPKPKAGFLKLLQTRLLSFGVIGSLGFILLVSLAVTAFVEGLSDKLKHIFPDFTVVLFYIINLLLTLGVTTILFAIIFKVLPDAKIKWKIVWPGAILTSLLFMLGKFLISFYIAKSQIGTTYGAAGSLVVLLVWVYYSSIILYFGAEFTKAFAFQRGGHIEPNEYATFQEKPVVAGAHPADRRRHKEPVIMPASVQNQEYRNHPVITTENGKNKPPGMGTALLGLLLYVVRSSSRK
jgi:membrane protein